MVTFARDVVDQLTVKCKRPTLGTNAAMISICADRVELVFGQPSLLGGVAGVTREILPFADYPEMRNLYGPAGWNIAEVNALLCGLE